MPCMGPSHDMATPGPCALCLLMRSSSHGMAHGTFTMESSRRPLAIRISFSPCTRSSSVLPPSLSSAISMPAPIAAPGAWALREDSAKSERT